MMFEGTVVIPANHPALAGHFPGSPIVPGAVVLDEAIDMARQKGGWKISGVTMAKFTAPLRYETPCFVRLSGGKNGPVKLTCTVDDEPVLTAVLSCVGGSDTAR